MGRLTGKNILMIIPVDYYSEDELEIPHKIFTDEGANVIVASGKIKKAVGMKTGYRMPDRLIVDAMEGITGDTYVTTGGQRQIKGIFHGTVIVGGNGARKHLWKEKLVRLLLVDRHRSEFVVAGIGQGIGCLAEASLVENLEVTVDADAAKKPFLEILDQGKAILVNEDVIVHDRVVTGRDASVAEAFARAVVEEVAKITKIK
jgi:putative intracellular protease/amidase